jgi:L-iditol 2-dehydrogenase
VNGQSAPTPLTLVDVARLHAPGDVRVVREPEVVPERGEVRLRVTAVGLCGSDIHWYDEASIGDARLEQPLVLGHEFTGIIADGERAGQRVVGDPSDPCGTCEQCLAGSAHLCLALRFAGHGRTDGALRSVMAWPARLLHPLPDAIGDEEAALLEPLGVALHALDLARLPGGGSAGVFGCGPIGLLLVQLLRRAGASTIVATDRLVHRVAAAAAMGSTYAVEAESEADPGRLPPLDVAFEVAGDDSALADAIRTVRPGGRIVLVGIPPRDRATFPAAAARRKELSLLLCRRMHPSDLSRAIGLAAEGSVALAPLITDRFPLTAAPAAFAALAARRGLKLIVQP